CPPSMYSHHLIRLACASLLFSLASLRGEEDNAWPFFVRRSTNGNEALQAVGPLFFAQSSQDLERHGVRPFYLETVSNGSTEGSFLYPFFTWRQQEDYRTFSFFQLINTRTDTTGDGPADERFDVWPFWFSRDN